MDRALLVSTVARLPPAARLAVSAARARPCRDVSERGDERSAPRASAPRNGRRRRSQRRRPREGPFESRRPANAPRVWTGRFSFAPATVRSRSVPCHWPVKRGCFAAARVADATSAAEPHRGRSRGATRYAALRCRRRPPQRLACTGACPGDGDDRAEARPPPAVRPPSPAVPPPPAAAARRRPRRRARDTKRRRRRWLTPATPLGAILVCRMPWRERPSRARRYAHAHGAHDVRACTGRPSGPSGTRGSGRTSC